MADLLRFRGDLHVHGLYSGGVSNDMVPKVIAREARLKGLNILGSGDILNDKWLKLFLSSMDEKVDEAIFRKENTYFILQAEVEDITRVHHLLFFPSVSKVQEFKEAFKSKVKDFDTDGRPKIRAWPYEIAEVANQVGALIGFAHAFTPYTGLFGRYKSYREAYGNASRYVHFLELGLSADTFLADQISELHALTFLSNSDAHSPWPHRMGREFNIFELPDLNFKEFENLLKRKGKAKMLLNVGFDPKEGKYHATRCRKCGTYYDLEDAIALKFRCFYCKGIIKKGVRDRILELADLPQGKHPEHRPKYIHIIPLLEIISLAHSKGVQTKTVLEIWRKFIEEFGDEISILLDIPIEDLERIDPKTSTFISYFRDRKITYLPGGAGFYGKLVKPGEKPSFRYYKKEHLQKKLSDFFKS